MKASEIRDLTTEEVQARLKDEREKLLRLRLNHAVSAIEIPADIQHTRRSVARLITILKERELAEQAK